MRRRRSRPTSSHRNSATATTVCPVDSFRGKFFVLSLGLNRSHTSFLWCALIKPQFTLPNIPSPTVRPSSYAHGLLLLLFLSNALSAAEFIAYLTFLQRTIPRYIVPTTSSGGINSLVDGWPWNFTRLVGESEDSVEKKNSDKTNNKNSTKSIRTTL